MQCSACGYENPDNSAYCQRCAEGLSATRKEYHRVGRTESDPASLRKDSRTPLIPFSQKEPSLRIGLPPDPATKHPPVVWNWKPFWLIGRLVLVAVAIGGAGILFQVLRRPTDFETHGSFLKQYFFEYAPFRYYAIEKSDGDVWAARNDQLDTQLAQFRTTDSGPLVITTLSSTANRQTLLVESAEWAHVEETPSGTQTSTLPLQDPSLAPATVMMDKQGYVLQHNAIATWRLGKTLPFLLPVLPAGVHRLGDTWTEPVAWVDRFGDWEIQWTGDLDWTWQGFEKGSTSERARLLYQGRLTPTLRAAPRWARDRASPLHFDGRANGKAFYDPTERRIVANSFDYEGAITLPVADLGAIPAYRREGLYRRQPGRLVLHFKNQIDIGIP